MSDLEHSIIDRRIKQLEEDARINKSFRDYVTKHLAEWLQGKMNSKKEHIVPETAPDSEQKQPVSTKRP